MCFIYTYMYAYHVGILYCTNQLVGTTDGHKLFNAEHTIIILSMAGHSPDFLGLTNSIGMQLIKIEYHWQVAPITRSMCMRTLAS